MLRYGRVRWRRKSSKVIVASLRVSGISSSMWCLMEIWFNITLTSRRSFWRESTIDTCSACQLKGRTSLSGTTINLIIRRQSVWACCTMPSWQLLLVETALFRSPISRCLIVPSQEWWCFKLEITWAFNYHSTSVSRWLLWLHSSSSFTSRSA